MNTGLRENDLMCIVYYTLKRADSQQMHMKNEIHVDKFGTPAKKSVDDASGRRIRSFRIDWPTRHNQTQ